MTKTKEQAAARVDRVTRLLRSYAADAMKSNATTADVDEYVRLCREFTEAFLKVEAKVWAK